MRNSNPILRTEENFDRLGNAKVFSNLDLINAFHRIRICSEYIEKTYLNSKYAQFKFLVMLIGLCNGFNTFQTMMIAILMTLQTHF